MKVIIYTDGGADPNPGVGGWAAVLRAGGREKVLTGSDPHTTNNRMELQAAVAALNVLDRPSQVELHTDSIYLQKGITEWVGNWAAKGWQRKGRPIPNVDLWRELLALTRIHDVSWHWVRGHAGDPLNTRVDLLARQARLAITAPATYSPDVGRLFVRASCLGNPGPGAWAAVVERDGDTEQYSGTEPRTSNNRMELRGAIAGLQQFPPGSAVVLFTTSDYVFQGATRWRHNWKRNRWKKKDGQLVANADLWQELDGLLERYAVEWVNAKGGREEPGLAEAERLAREALADS